MSQYETNWTYNEFLAYILFYAANADLEIKPEERELIISKVDTVTYVTIKKEFAKDNDFTQLEKIRNYCKVYLTDSEAKDKLFKDIEEMFLVDGKYSSIEKNFFLGLKRVIIK